ncbi:DUF431-domain-containing protein [Serendipita vermifera]|nr:DUF431-domain-containing protein [Serendipita vermifera]
MARFTYVIEHMEEDEKDKSSSLPQWVLLEYSHIVSLIAPDGEVAFTHLSSSSCKELEGALAASQTAKTGGTHNSYTISVLELMKQRNVPLDRVCLLDPKAEKELTPTDGDGEFDFFLFGGILGDHPPRDRTGELRVLGFPTRHLGSVQMTTDTAVGVTKLVVDDKKSLQSIPYTDFPTIRFNKSESVEMPFRYIAKDGEPLLPVGMKQHLYEDLNRGFDF